MSSVQDPLEKNEDLSAAQKTKQDNPTYKRKGKYVTSKPDPRPANSRGCYHAGLPTVKGERKKKEAFPNASPAGWEEGVGRNGILTESG